MDICKNIKYIIKQKIKLKNIEKALKNIINF